MGYVEKIFVKFEDRVVVQASARETLTVADDHQRAREVDASTKLEEPQEEQAKSADQAERPADDGPDNISEHEAESTPPVYAYQFLWRSSNQSVSCGYPGTAGPSVGSEKRMDIERPSQQTALDASNMDGAFKSSSNEGFRAVTDPNSGQAESTNNRDASEGSLPTWVRGIYSLRIGGAEFKRREGCDPEGITESGAMWIAGLEAREMAEASDEEVQRALRAVFRAFPAAGLPERFSFYRTRWAVKPLSRGSYSYPAKGCDGTEFEQLATPVTVTMNRKPIPVLQFAGALLCRKCDWFLKHCLCISL